MNKNVPIVVGTSKRFVQTRNFNLDILTNACDLLWLFDILQFLQNIVYDNCSIGLVKCEKYFKIN